MICSAIRNQHERFGCSRSPMPGPQNLALRGGDIFSTLTCPFKRRQLGKVLRSSRRPVKIGEPVARPRSRFGMPDYKWDIPDTSRFRLVAVAGPPAIAGVRIRDRADLTFNP